MTGPLISVIVPAYNAGRFLPEAIASIQAQNYPEIEILLIDDGSTDNTPEIAAGFGSAVRYFRKPNGGQASARNLGLREARGEIFAFLDADDQWPENKLALQLPRLTVDDATDVVSGRGVDWKILVNACAEWDIVPYALHALAFLRGRFGAAIPEWVPDELSRARVSSATQAEFQRECAPAAPRTAWADLLSLYARWRRSLGGASPMLHGAGFLRHLQYAFELESPWALPAQFGRSAMRRLGRKSAS